MVAPAVIYGAFAIGGAIMSYLQSSESAKISQKQRQELYNLAQQTQEPDFDMRDITPEQFKAVDAFVPTAVPFIAEQAPEIVEKNATMKEAQGAQMDSLRYLQQLARSGVDPLAEMDRLKASRQAAQEASLQRANMESGMQRRGVGMDSGLSLGLQQQAAGQAGYRTAMAGEEAARDALNRRNQASTQSAQIGGQVFGQEANIEEHNASIINGFNQRMAQRRQAITSGNIEAANAAAANARANQQAINNLNTNAANTAAIRNQDNQNRIKQEQYNNKMKKLGILGNAQEGAIQSQQQGSQATAGLYQGLGQGLGTLAAGYAQNSNEEEARRKRIERYGYDPQDYK
jgi:hypothetical protein